MGFLIAAMYLGGGTEAIRRQRGTLALVAVGSVVALAAVAILPAFIGDLGLVPGPHRGQRRRAGLERGRIAPTSEAAPARPRAHRKDAAGPPGARRPVHGGSGGHGHRDHPGVADRGVAGPESGRSPRRRPDRLLSTHDRRPDRCTALSLDRRRARAASPPGAWWARADATAAARGLLAIPGSRADATVGLDRRQRGRGPLRCLPRRRGPRTRRDRGQDVAAAGDPAERRAAGSIGPTTAARWDLHGLLMPLDDALLDADPAVASGRSG